MVYLYKHGNRNGKIHKYTRDMENIVLINYIEEFSLPDYVDYFPYYWGIHDSVGSVDIS